jgi:cyanophycinase
MEVVGRGTITVVDPADLRHSSMSYVRKAAPVTLIGMTLHLLAEGARFNLETRQALPAAD